MLSTKKIAGTSSERFRLLINDGRNSNSYGMLATQLNGLVHSGDLDEFCVFKCKKQQCNIMQGKKVIIILELEVGWQPLLLDCLLISAPIPGASAGAVAE